MCKLRHPGFRKGLCIRFEYNEEVLHGEIFEIYPHEEKIHVSTERWEKEPRMLVITWNDIIMEL